MKNKLNTVIRKVASAGAGSGIVIASGAIGAVIGSVIPVIGTAIGAGIGAAAGGIAGAAAAKSIDKSLKKTLKSNKAKEDVNAVNDQGIFSKNSSFSP